MNTAIGSHRPEEDLPSGIDVLQPWYGPAIILVDLDAFFASVEQLDHPEWRGLPVIVGGDSERRGVVSTCSYEARIYGVKSAMPSAQARRLCPDAIWTHGSFPRYIEISKQVMMILRETSPLLQQVSIDEAFLDISPGRFVTDHPVKLASRIQERVSELGVTCSIGLGVSKSVAKIASDIDKPNGLTVVFPGRETDFLSPLPIHLMSGIGKVAEKRLSDLGIHTLGQVAAADLSVLKGIFGKNAEMMRNRCLGSDASPVTCEHDVKSISNELTFSTDLTEIDEIRQAVAMLAAKVGRRLRHKRLKGYTVTLKLRFGDLSIRTAQRTLTHSVDDERIFTPVLHDLTAELWQPGLKLRLIGVGVSTFDARPEQMSLFGIEGLKPDIAMDRRDLDVHGHRQRSLLEATDKVKDRFGENALRYGRELRFDERDTGTIAQKKDDYKDPLYAPDDNGPQQYLL